jgi:hypothetical protein
MKDKQRESHRLTYCEKPGGGNEYGDVVAKVQAWITATLPKRPNGEQPRVAQQRDDQRKRSERSQSRTRDQPRKQEGYPEGFNPWEFGENYERRRRHAMQMLVSARKELADFGRVTDELKRGLQTIKEQYEESDATRQIANFQETLPYIERMNDIRKVLQEDQKGNNQDRLDRGELRKEVIRILPEGLGSYEGDNPGASSSGETKPMIKAFKVIKVELEEDEPEGMKITLAMIAAVILTLVTQLLFMKCKKRHNPVETVNIEREEVRK